MFSIYKLMIISLPITILLPYILFSFNQYFLKFFLLALDILILLHFPKNIAHFGLPVTTGRDRFIEIEAYKQVNLCSYN